MATTNATLQIIANKINFYVPIVIVTVGVIGSVCNLITFTALKLRKNSCAFYFLIATLFELSYITFGLLSSSASALFGSNLSSTDRIYCKVRAYLVYAIGLMPTYLILLASVDRFMSSSAHARLRAFSQIKVAYRATVGAIVTAFVSCVHVPIIYDLRPRCSSLRGALAMFDSMFVVFWLGVIPHVLMLIFGFLTLANIRRTKRRIVSHPAAAVDATGPNKQQRRDQKTQTQLIAVSDARGRAERRNECLCLIVDDACPSGNEHLSRLNLRDHICILCSPTTRFGIRSTVQHITDLSNGDVFLCQLCQVILYLHPLKPAVPFDLRGTREARNEKGAGSISSDDLQRYPGDEH